MIYRFFKKIAILVALILVILTVFLVYYHNQIDNLKIDNNINVIVCGDSHTQSAINDSILEHSLNISQSSEPYMATYNVIRTLVNSNPQIKTVILGYSYHSLSEIYDDVVYKEEGRGDFYSTYLPILYKESIILLANHNFNGIVKSFPKSFNIWQFIRNHKNPNIKNFNFFGKYYASTNSNCNSTTINNAIKRHYYKQSGEKSFSILQEQYLMKITQFCNKRQIKVILLNTPISKEYSEKIPIKFKTKYYNLVRELENQSVLLDFHDLNIKRDCYGDGDHINEFGAKILTSKIDSLLFSDNYKKKL